VPATSATAKPHPNLIDRFIGEEAHIVGRDTLAINNFIQAEWLEVAIPEFGEQEDYGILYLFPVDDNQFYLQLCYMQHPETSSMNATVTSLRFSPAFFEQYPPETLMQNQPFRFDQSTELQFQVCSQAAQLLGQLQQGALLTPFTRALQQSETSMHLLRRALECITIPFTVCQVPACRFLMYESERTKIQDARMILDVDIDKPYTIKELSRKVAMNECYLKKGFKALVGKTIHEYQMEQRINKAKTLLREDGQSVTDVANMLGFSSISHFSTAFKRITGMKPCELLA
jgi:AraC-like DNA-binding protein